MRGVQVHRLPEQEEIREGAGKRLDQAPSPDQRNRHPRTREPKPDLASNGGTSPLRSEYWCHLQKGR
jgi:hypothetical protein